MYFWCCIKSQLANKLQYRSVFVRWTLSNIMRNWQHIIGTSLYAKYFHFWLTHCSDCFFAFTKHFSVSYVFVWANSLYPDAKSVVYGPHLFCIVWVVGTCYWNFYFLIVWYTSYCEYNIRPFFCVFSAASHFVFINPKKRWRKGRKKQEK